MKFDNTMVLRLWDETNSGEMFSTVDDLSPFSLIRWFPPFHRIIDLTGCKNPLF